MIADENQSSKTGKGATLLLFKDLLTQFASIIFYALLARVVSINDLGLVLGLTLISNFVTFWGTFGLPEAASKYIASYKAKKEIGTSISSEVLTTGIVSSGVILISMILFSINISAFFLGSAEYGLIVSMIAFAAVFELLVVYFRGIQKGWQNFRIIAISESILSISKVTIGAILLLLGFGVMGVIFGWISGSLLGVISYAIFSRNIIRRNTNQRFSKALLGFGSSVYIALIFEYLSANVERFFIIQWISLEYLGYFVSAITIAGITGVIYGSIGGSIYPIMAELNENEGISSTLNFARVSSRFVLLFTLPILMGLASISHYVVLIFLGDGFDITANVLIPLCFVTGISALSGVTNTFALAIGRPRYLIESNIFGFIIGLVGSYILIPIYSIGGALLARILIQVSIQLYIWIRISVKFGNPIDLNSMGRLWLSAIIVFIVVVTLRFLVDSIIFLPIYIFSGVLAYAIVIRLTGAITEKDLVIILSIFPEKIRIRMKPILMLITTKNPISDK